MTDAHKTPPELFHYTGLHGLQGIVESQTLWATHSSFVNDHSEIIAFEPTFRAILRPSIEEGLNDLESISKLDYTRILKTIGREGYIQAATDGVVNGFFGGLRQSEHIHKQGPSFDAFITSFCTTNDVNEERHGLLSQWRGYGADGGYAIVFDTERLIGLIEEQNRKCPWIPTSLERVSYSSTSMENLKLAWKEDIEAIQQEQRKLVPALVLKYKDKKLLEDLENTGSSTIRKFLRLACKFKHWGFREENEVRVIAFSTTTSPRPVTDTEYRDHQQSGLSTAGTFPRAGTPVPYISIFSGITRRPDKLLPIKRVIG